MEGLTDRLPPSQKEKRKEGRCLWTYTQTFYADLKALWFKLMN